MYSAFSQKANSFQCLIWYSLVGFATVIFVQVIFICLFFCFVIVLSPIAYTVLAYLCEPSGVIYTTGGIGNFVFFFPPTAPVSYSLQEVAHFLRIDQEYHG